MERQITERGKRIHLRGERHRQRRDLDPAAHELGFVLEEAERVLGLPGDRADARPAQLDGGDRRRSSPQRQPLAGGVSPSSERDPEARRRTDSRWASARSGLTVGSGNQLVEVREQPELTEHLDQVDELQRGA